MALRAGYIGLGNIGKPMASCWVKAGFETAVYDVVEAPVAELVELGARAAPSPRAVGEAADVIGICVRDDDDVRGVLLGDDGVFSGAAEGTVVLIHSTIQPATAVEMSAEGAEHGVSVIDAAITGGKLYLAAYTLRLGATGLTFYDDDVTAFFSPHAAGKSVMFLTALGRPLKRTPRIPVG